VAGLLARMRRCLEAVHRGHANVTFARACESVGAAPPRPRSIRAPYRRVWRVLELQIHTAPSRADSPVLHIIGLACLRLRVTGRRVRWRVCHLCSCPQFSGKPETVAACVVLCQSRLAKRPAAQPDATRDPDLCAGSAGAASLPARRVFAVTWTPRSLGRIRRLRRPSSDLANRAITGCGRPRRKLLPVVPVLAILRAERSSVILSTTAKRTRRKAANTSLSVGSALVRFA
jgi:hypothetical protein